MSKDKLVAVLIELRTRLLVDVVQSYEQLGASYGNDRFHAWRRHLAMFLDENLPGESRMLNYRRLLHKQFTMRPGETDAQRFWRQEGENMVLYLDSLIQELEKDEYEVSGFESEEARFHFASHHACIDPSKIFIVHGHDGEAKERTARFIEMLGFKPIILHEQANRGRTIIEKMEKYSNVGFAIVLYTPDDVGNGVTEAKKGQLQYRARQNVVFEHGLLIGKIGRENVVSLVAGDMELPSDISGVVYINDKEWQLKIAKEMKDAGYNIDFNKLL